MQRINRGVRNSAAFFSVMLLAALVPVVAACRPCSSTTSSLASAEAAHRAATPGTPLAEVLRVAAPADISMDVQVMQCGSALPLRASADNMGGMHYSGYRGGYSPSGDESDKDYEEWQFASAAEMAERLHAEAVKTSCRQLFLGYYDGCGRHAFRATLKDGRIASTEPVDAWK